MMFFTALLIAFAALAAGVFLRRVIETAADLDLSGRQACIGFAVVVPGSLSIMMIASVLKTVPGGDEWSGLIGGGLELSLLSATTMWLAQDHWTDFFKYLFIIPMAILVECYRVIGSAFIPAMGCAVLSGVIGQLPAAILGTGMAFWVYWADGKDLFWEGGEAISSSSSSSPDCQYQGSTYQPGPTTSYSPPNTAATSSSSPTVGNWDANTYGAAQTGRQNGANY